MMICQLSLSNKGHRININVDILAKLLKIISEIELFRVLITQNIMTYIEVEAY